MELEIRCLFWVESTRIGHYREYPSPRHRRAVTNITSRASTRLTVILNYDYSWPNWFFNREETQRITSPNDQHFRQNNPSNACDGNVAVQSWFHQSQRGCKWYRWNWLDLRNWKRNFGRRTCRKENRIYLQGAEIPRSCHKWEINEDRPLVSCVRSCSCLVTSDVVVNLCGEKPDHVLADRPADSPAFLRTCSIP